MAQRIFEFARKGLPYHLVVLDNVGSEIAKIKHDNIKSTSNHDRVKLFESANTNKSKNDFTLRCVVDAVRKFLPTLSVCYTALDWLKVPYTHCSAEASSENDHPSLSMFSPTVPIQIIRPNKHLEICFDNRTRNAVYVQHRIVADEYYRTTNRNYVERIGVNSDESGQRITEQTDYDIDEDRDSKLDINKGKDNKGAREGRRRYRFKEEVGVPEVYRSRNSHFHNSGYDRGHLAPAADFKNLNTNDNIFDYVQQTYNLCNVSPQNQDMNRKIWSYLESWVRNVTRMEHENEMKRMGTTTSNIVMYVTTGPLWLPKQKISDNLFEYQYNAIGKPPSLVQVPTHFFKVVLLVKVDPTKSNAVDDKIQIRKFACFVIPNDSSSAGKSIGEYLVPWTDLEAVTGLVFYPQLVTDQIKYAADTLTDRIKSSFQIDDKTRKVANRQETTLRLTDGTNINRQSSSSSTSNAMTRFFHGGKMNKDANLGHLCQYHTCIRPPSKGVGS